MAKDAFGDDIPMWGAAPAARAGDPSPEQERWSPAVPPSSNGWSKSESADVHTATPVAADVPWPWLAGSALSVLAALALAAQAAGRPLLAITGWLLGGFLAVGLVAGFTLADLRRRSSPWHSSGPGPGALRSAVLLAAVLSVAANAWRFADWAGRR